MYMNKGQRTRTDLVLFFVFLCGTFRFCGACFSNAWFSGVQYILFSSFFIMVGIILIDLKIKVKFLIFFMIYISVIIFAKGINGSGWGSLFLNIFGAFMIFTFYLLPVKKSEMNIYVLMIGGHMLLFTICVLCGSDQVAGYLGVYNKNSIGALLVFECAILLTYINKIEIQAILHVIILPLLFYMGSRTTMLAYILVVGLKWYVAKRNGIKLLKLLYWFYMIAGLAIPIAYVWMYNHYDIPFIQNLVHVSLKLFNKNFFTGREIIWNEAFEIFLDSPWNVLFGIGTHAFENGSNSHSSFFNILVCSGLIGYVLFSILLGKLFFGILYRGDQNSTRACAIYLGLMMIGLSESILFNGEYAVLGYSVLLIGKMQTVERKDI